MTLVLASASPRRREILAALGIAFEAVASNAEELQEGPPERVVVENARRKARAGRKLAPGAGLVLGADTEVVLEGRVLGKATSAAQARERLEALSGREHEVLGAIVILDRAGGERSGIARSRVRFRRLDEAVLELYLASGEWRDRAGAYAIQGLGSLLVERVEGDFSNVVGLSVELLLQLAPELREAGTTPSG